MTFLPITQDIVHEAEFENLVVEGLMLRDFGPWKKGEEKTLSFDFATGICDEYDMNGTIKHSVRLELGVVREG